jgi:Tfp pilus assembly protein PilF
MPVRPLWLIAATALLVVAVGACGGGDDASEAPQSPFATVADRSVAYVGDAACGQCHGNLVASYATHGMAQSFYALTADNAVETWPSGWIEDAAGYRYRAYRDGDRFVQEEQWRGSPEHRLVREVAYVVGSGSAARTYLAEENGRLFQLPLTFYTQQGRWDFSPGYEQQNPRFSRLVPDACMTCHNATPEPVAFAEGKYERVPQGIGCEQCHGPGALHVDKHLGGAPEGEPVDYSIVNPAHLSAELQLDVCQQCHLQGSVMLRREGEDAYSYRPGMPLGEHVALFSPDVPTSVTEVGIISHAERMKQSACFEATPTMTCTTCHDPHEGFRDKGPDYFNATCQTCHAPDELQVQFGEAEMVAQHAASANCQSCHMPKVESHEAPHSSFTDHWIRVVRDTIEVLPDASDAPLVAYFARDRDGVEGEALRGMANIVYGTQRGESERVGEGIALVRQALADGARLSEAEYLLGFALLGRGQTREALPYLERAARHPIPERFNTLAQAYEATGRTARVDSLYRAALDLQPALAAVRVNYGRFLERTGRTADARAQYAAAAAEQPSLGAAHYNLGTLLLRAGEYGSAEAALRRAVALEPTDAEARGNLGLLYASQGDAAAARAQFEAAVAGSPNSATALGNLGTFHLNEGRPGEAEPLLLRAVERDPAYVDGWVNLTLLYARAQDRRAVETLRRALAVAPSDPRVQQLAQMMGG